VEFRHTVLGKSELKQHSESGSIQNSGGFQSKAAVTFIRGNNCANVLEYLGG